MSHYACAIVTAGRPEEWEIAEILAPYDENKEVERIVTRQELIEKTRKRIEKDKKLYDKFMSDPNFKETATESQKKFVKEFPKRLALTDEECWREAVEYYEKQDIHEDGSVTDRYNPLAKWDWWTIGGRWNYDLFRFKPNREDYDSQEAYELVRNDSLYENEGRVEDIVNWEDPAQARKAELFWDLYVEGKEPETEEEKEAKKRIDEMFFKYVPSEYARRYGNKEGYVEAMSAVTAYAVIDKNGEWHSQGAMGWFAVSDEEDGAAARWPKIFKELLTENIEEGNYVTIVDLHI